MTIIRHLITSIVNSELDEYILALNIFILGGLDIKTPVGRNSNVYYKHHILI
jgi:hypothetical protein